MNRRTILSISAIAASGLAPVPTAGFAQQASEAEAVTAASRAFYAALAVLDNGEAMEKVWAHRPYITFVGPRSKSIIVGWDSLKKYWPQANKMFAERKISLTAQHIHVVGNLAWEMVNEVGEPKMADGTVTKTDNLATGIYEKIDGRWLKVSHHALRKPA